MKRLIVIFGVLVLFVAYLTFSIKLHLPSSTDYTPTITPLPTQLNSDTLWSLVQKWRTDKGLQPYIKDQNLCSYASKRAVQIQSDFSHSGFSIKNVCGNAACRAGENLSGNYYSESDTLSAWLASPEHLKNLKDSFTNSCVECSGLYCAQEFVVFTNPAPQTNNLDYKTAMSISMTNCLNQSGQAVQDTVAHFNAMGYTQTPDDIKMLTKMAIDGCYQAAGLTPPMN